VLLLCGEVACQRAGVGVDAYKLAAVSPVKVLRFVPSVVVSPATSLPCLTRSLLGSQVACQCAGVGVDAAELAAGFACEGAQVRAERCGVACYKACEVG